MNRIRMSIMFQKVKTFRLEEQLRVLLKLLIILLLFMTQFVINLKLRTLDTSWVEPVEEHRVKWDPGLTKAVSFGFVPVMIDWLWMLILTDPNVSKVAPGTHPQLYYDLDLITDLDEAFMEVYINGGNLLAVIRDDGMGARDLLKKGVNYFSSEGAEFRGLGPINAEDRLWNLYVVLAYVYLFELNNMPEASKAFQTAANQPSAPKYLERLSKTLSLPGGEYVVGVRLLEFLATGATDLRVKQALRTKAENLNKGFYLFQINEKFREYRNKKHLIRNGLKEKSLDRVWKDFINEQKMDRQDPWGGELLLEGDKIRSTTPHKSVFGLE